MIPAHLLPYWRDVARGKMSREHYDLLASCHDVSMLIRGGGTEQLCGKYGVPVALREYRHIMRSGNVRAARLYCYFLGNYAAWKWLQRRIAAHYPDKRLRRVYRQFDYHCCHIADMVTWQPYDIS